MLVINLNKDKLQMSIIFVKLISGMFLSTVSSFKQIQSVNSDFINRSLNAQGFTIIKQKNRDIEVGLNINSFILQKNNISMVVFVLRLSKNQFLCAGYHHGKIVKEKEIKYQSDIPSTLADIFRQARPSPDDQPIRFDLQLQVMQQLCQRIEKKEKQINSFTQEVKTSKEYQNLKAMQKNIYAKLINDSTKLLQDRENIKLENNNLIQPLLRVQSAKQSLQSAIMAFEEENTYLSNVKERLRDNITQLRDNPLDVTSENLSEKSFENYLAYLTKLKEFELKQKYLIS